MTKKATVTLCPICSEIGRLAYIGRDFMFNGQEKFQYAHCASCEIDYQTPQPNQQQIADFYPETYDKHGVTECQKTLSWSRRAVLKYKYQYRHLPVHPAALLLAPLLGLFKYRNTMPYVTDGTALDVGCGNGKFLQSLQQMGWHTHGIDFSDNAVRSCAAAGLDVCCGELENTDFPDETFDLVTARHVIEHVPDPKGFVQAIARVTKIGGRVLLRTPNNNALGKRYFGAYWFPNEIPRHLMLFSPKIIDALLQQQGFRKVTLKTLAKPRFVLKSLDYKRNNQGRSYRKSRVYRLLAMGYALVANALGRGDEIYAVYEKTGA